MRLNVEMSEKDYQLLDKMMRLADINSKKDLVEYALLFLSWGLSAAFDGKKIAAIDDRNTRYQELQMPPFQKAAMLGEGERLSQAEQAKKTSEAEQAKKKVAAAAE